MSSLFIPLSPQISPGGGQRKFAVLYSSRPDQPIADILDFFTPASHHQDLQAIVFIHMDMQGGKDGLVVIVLHLGQNAGELAGVMAVH